MMRIPSVFVPLLLSTAALSSQAQAPRAVPPRLCVLLSVDQLAEWLYAKGSPFFASDGGFRRLEERGVTFVNCAYEHACTETGPGHATIGTGAPASVHGIGKNSWWSPETGKSVYCVGEEAEALDALPEGADRGPGRLMVPTFAESVKAHVPQSRVASIAWKDRSAILMGGPAADVCAWFEKKRGMLVTNKNWCDEVPQWMAEFNASRAIDQWFGKMWDRTGPDEAYVGLEDDRRYEWPHLNGSREHTLPQPMTGGKEAPELAYYEQLYASPFGNTAVRLAAEAALRGMALGKDDAPDLLCVSFSSTDVLGHYFGPDSVEARDALLRLDRELGLLFDTFDREVGAGRWTVFVTADHGVAPTPEFARSQGVPAGRGPIDAWVRSAVERALKKELGDAKDGEKYVAHVGDNAVYLNPKALTAPGIGIMRMVADAAGKVRGVQCAYASADLVDDHDHPEPVRRALAFAMVPGRVGAAQFVLAPYWLNGGTPASHGSPHTYDREVVGFAYGPGLRAGARVATPITPGFGVVLFAHALSIPKPSGARENVPAGLFGLR